MCWLRHGMILFFTGMFLLVLLPSDRAENQTYNNSECAFGDIESRLSIAAEIIETAKQKLPKDLKELCKNFVSNDCNTFDSNETNSCDCNDTKILDCNETQVFECNETQILDCREYENRTCYVRPLDCSDIYQDGERRNGLYDIWPERRVSTGRLQVYCDMESNGGGWTVIQRRGDYDKNAEYFYRKWDAYKTGFGDMLKEFWIGNDNLFALTSQRMYQLRVNLTSWEGEVAYATYDEFWVLNETANYALHVTGYNGTAGDSLAHHDGMEFSTVDRKNDKSSGNCAESFKGAWWYNYCLHSNLNGMYLRGDNEYTGRGVVWRTFKGTFHSHRDVVMKIRPAGFPDDESNIM